MPTVETKEAPKSRKRRYQLLAGTHTQDHPDGPDPVTGKRRSVRYEARDPKNNIVESEINLAERWPEKFRLVDERQSMQVVKPLESMTVGELRAYAEQADIDLGTAVKKEEIVNTIRAALPG